MTRRLWLIALTLFIIGIAVYPNLAVGQGGGHQEVVSAGSSNVSWGWIAVGSGLAVGLAGLGTGIAQSRIGAAGVAGIAEDRGMLGLVIMLVAIPESVLIFGFVIAYLLYTKM
jgi:V/A-type H+-transporting ATPase subunit K